MPALNSLGAFSVVEPRQSQHEEEEIEPPNYVQMFDGPQFKTDNLGPVDEEELLDEEEEEEEVDKMLNDVFDQIEQQNKYLNKTADKDVMTISEDEEMPEDKEESENAMDIITENTVLTSFKNINVTHGDINRLRNRQRLNDNIIELYLQLLIYSSESNTFYAFSTGYFTHLTSSRLIKQPPRWAIKELASATKYLIPIYHENEEHWSLIYVDTLAKNVFHFDSFFGPSSELINKIKQHFNNCIPKLNNMMSWNTVFDGHVPLQQNAIDCGVFLCLFARHLTLAQTFSFTQDDIVGWRKQMEYEIKNLELIEHI